MFIVRFWTKLSFINKFRFQEISVNRALESQHDSKALLCLLFIFLLFCFMMSIE